MTDAEWDKMREEAIMEYMEEKDKLQQIKDELKSL
jgi:hypothetical protein